MDFKLQLNYYALPILISGLVLLFLTWESYRIRNRVQGILSFSISMLMAAIYTVFYFFELCSLNLDTAYFFLKMQYIGIPFLSLFFMFFALQYSGRLRQINKMFAAGFLLIPILITILVFTNSYHNLHLTSIFFSTSGRFPVIVFTAGPAYWLHQIYSIALLLVGILVFTLHYFSSSGVFRSQNGMLLLATLIPYVFYIAYLSGFSPYGIDPIPVGFAVMGVIALLGMKRYGLFRLLPSVRQRLFESLPDGVIVVDNENRLLDFNARASRFLGLGKDDFGKKLPEVFSAEPELAIIFSGDIIERNDLLINRSDKNVWVRILTEPLLSKHKDIQGYIYVIRDVSRRYLADVARNESEEKRIKTLEELRHSQDELLYRNQLNEILVRLSIKFINSKTNESDVQINEALAEIGHFTHADRVYVFEYLFDKGIMRNSHEWCATGISPEIENLQEVSMKDFDFWVSAHSEGRTIQIPDVDLVEDEPLKELLKSQSIKSLITFPMIADEHCLGFVGFDAVKETRSWNNDELILLRLFAELLANLQTKMSYERKLIVAIDQAEEGNAIKTSFIRSISHEIRTPIYGMQSAGHLLATSNVSDEDRAILLKGFDESLTRLLNTLDNYLDASILLSGSLIPIKTSFSVADFIKGIETEFAGKAARKQLRFLVDAESGTKELMLETDRTMLQKAISQILDNSIKFTQRGDVILSFTVSEKQLHVEITDTGVGIRDDYKSKVFELFSQQDMSLRKNYDGSGLGLNIAKCLVEKLNGHIYFSSEEGKGSCFIIKIPLND